MDSILNLGFVREVVLAVIENSIFNMEFASIERSVHVCSKRRGGVLWVVDYYFVWFSVG